VVPAPGPTLAAGLALPSSPLLGAEPHGLCCLQECAAAVTVDGVLDALLALLGERHLDALLGWPGQGAEGARDVIIVVIDLLQVSHPQRATRGDSTGPACRHTRCWAPLVRSSG
jgi:hypothetical protein